MLEELIKEEYKKYLESIFEVDKENEFIEKIISNKLDQNNNDCFYHNIRFDKKPPIFFLQLVKAIKLKPDNFNLRNFSCGLAVIENDNDYNKYNFIDKEGNLLLDKWLDYADDFSEGYASFMINNKWNFIDKEGNQLLEEWLNYAKRFSEGYATGRIGNKNVVIDTEGNIIAESYEKYDETVGPFFNGHARFKKEGKYGFVNLKLQEVGYYDYAWHFSEGYAQVKINNKWYFINTNIELASNQYYEETENFCNGYAIVKKNNKWNFIDKSHNLILKEGIDCDQLYSFYDGYARIYDKSKGYNFIDKTGKLLSEEWYDYADNFSEGYAVVKKNNKWNFIDTNGNLLSRNWIFCDNMLSFYEGYAQIEQNKKCNFIDKKGKLIFRNWYIHASNFHDGYTIIRNNNGLNYINSKEELLLKNQYFYKCVFNDGYTIVENHIGKYNFVDINGNLLLKKFYYTVKTFHNGYAAIKEDNKWRFINKEGNFISNDYYDEVGNFYEKRAWVKINNKYNFINTEGDLISKKWYDYADLFSCGIARVGKKQPFSSKMGYNFINKRGELLLDEWNFGSKFQINYNSAPIDDTINIVFLYNNGYKIMQNGNTVYLLDDYNDIIMLSNSNEKIKEEDILKLKWKAIIDSKKVKNNFFSFEYNDDNITYKLKYEPVYNYNNFILCKNEEKYYLYSKSKNDYTFISNKEIKYGKNYLEFEGHTYFITDELVEVTGIKVSSSLELKDNIEEILEIEEFKDKYLNGEFYENALGKVEKSNIDNKKQELENIKKILAKFSIKKEEQRLEKIKELNDRLNSSAETLLNSFTNFLNIQKELEQLDNPNVEIKKMYISEEMLFIKMNDHLEINPLFLQINFLRYFDLTLISFTNVKISGIDLSYTNANINPQTVYNKDMSNGNYSGLNFTNKNFEGVNTNNSIFNDCIFDFTYNINLNEELNKVKTINKI